MDGGDEQDGEEPEEEGRGGEPHHGADESVGAVRRCGGASSASGIHGWTRDHKSPSRHARRAANPPSKPKPNALGTESQVPAGFVAAGQRDGRDELPNTDRPYYR